MKLVGRRLLSEVASRKPGWSHKGDYGRLLVVGGSKKYTGSSTIAALAAMRAGIDMVTLAAPRRAADVAASYEPGIITEPLCGDFLKESHMRTLMKMLETCDALVIGCGIGKEKSTARVVRKLISISTKPCVIDADGLHAISSGMTRLCRQAVLTPHAGEFRTLTGCSPGTSVTKRAEQARKLASKLGCIILLKGKTDIITDGKSTFSNKSGNQYMTRGGTGDMLAGVCGALLALGMKPLEAAAAAAWTTGKAGDIARQGFGGGFLISDAVSCIPRAIWRIRTGC